MARLRASVLSVALLGFAPVLGAQQPTAKPAAAKSAEAVPATHTVKRGDTLWDIAKRYLGDAYLWPEIYRLNTAIIEDPHWIYPGETLRLPAGATAIDEGPGEGGAARATDPNSMTVFNPKRYKRQSRGVRESVGLLASHQAVRPGDYLASPFVWSDDRKSIDGVVRSTAESQVVAPQLEPRVFQSEEAVFVTLPPGAPRTRGTTYLTYQLGPVLPGLGQVIIPTGVLMLEADAPPGDVRAVITKRFREVLAGQGVMPTDTLLPRRDVFPSRVEFGTATKLAWMLDRPVIAQMGGYVILDGKLTDGFNTGDQVTLRSPLGNGAAGEAREPEDAAVAQVLRVTPWGVSAILLRRGQGEMQVGMPGRITAKMP